jgi:hypothetical protein
MLYGKMDNIFDSTVIYVPIVLIFVCAGSLIPEFIATYLLRELNWQYYLIIVSSILLSIILWVVLYEMLTTYFLKIVTSRDTEQDWQEFWLVVSHSSDRFGLLYFLGLIAVVLISESMERIKNKTRKIIGYTTGSIFSFIYVYYAIMY